MRIGEKNPVMGNSLPMLVNWITDSIGRLSRSRDAVRLRLEAGDAAALTDPAACAGAADALALVTWGRREARACG